MENDWTTFYLYNVNYNAKDEVGDRQPSLYGRRLTPITP